MDSVDVKALNLNKSPIQDHDLELCKENKEVKKWPRSPFKVDTDINRRVVLYDSDLELLRADALVNPTNENLSQMNLVNKLAGPELDTYIRKNVKVCATGDVRITPGFGSNFKYIIHAVPPKFQQKYKTAAETALFHTYFRILETLIDKKIRTVVIPTLITAKCDLPMEDNFHMQLRIIRRILEKKRHEFDRIVIHVKDGNESLIPFLCYFPTNQLDEEVACYRLTNSIGGPNGEPVIPEREIRIKSKPSIMDPNFDKSIDLTSGLDLSTVVGKTAFSRMQGDFDRRRTTLKSTPSNNSSNQVALNKRSVFRGCNLL